MESESSPHSSLCMVRAEELFPKITLEKDDESLTMPLSELAGESFRYLGQTVEGVLAISNYRLYVYKSNKEELSVPLGLIESAVTRELNQVIISCKDASTVKCSFETTELCNDWQRRISLLTGIPPNLETLFAFPFYAWSCENKSLNNAADCPERLQRAPKFDEDFERERVRLKFKLNTDSGGGPWRISKVNAEFKLCPSYPRNIIVPACIDDADLHNVATFRSSRRIPAVVWRHKATGAIMARCSQPELGWLGWRNTNDELMLKAFVEACETDRNEIMRSKGADGFEADEEQLAKNRRLLIIDARSYASAVTNRARGGGCECTEYYTEADIDFMNLGNIHTIRKSFHQLRQLCASPPDNHNWLSGLERSLWLQHLAMLLSAAVTVCSAMEVHGRPVLVHCSDGWDRTPQILATSQLCLDPYYRTVEGFRILVEREWLGFGHKFADRCGHGPGSDEPNERCPVFLQWLDVVHQIHRQFPCSFEFSMGFLIKLAQHSHSCIFGTFLCNTLKERIDNSVFDRTFSVWTFLSEPCYKNPLYVPHHERVLWPAHHVRDLVLWSEVYLHSLRNQKSDNPRANLDASDSLAESAAIHEDEAMQSPPPALLLAHSAQQQLQAHHPSMTKTRSYNDLLKADVSNGHLPRRSSDPNMVPDLHPSPSNEPATSKTDILASHTKKDHMQQLDIENQALNDLIADNNLLAAKTLDSFDNMKMGNGFDSRLTTNNHSIKMLESEQNVKHEEKTADSAHGRLYENHTENGHDETDMRDVCLGSADTVDGGNEISAFHGFIHDGLNGLSTRDSSEEQQPSNSSEGIYLQSDLNRYESIENHQQLNGNKSAANTATDLRFPITQNLSYSAVLARNHQPIHAYESSVADLPLIHNNNHDVNPPNGCDIAQIHGRQQSSVPFQQHQHEINSCDSMEESIMIRPEFQRMEITNGGHMIGGIPPSHHQLRSEFGGTRTSSVQEPHISNGESARSSKAHFFSPGARSLPLTPPAPHERPLVAISCPDGLAHALSEQNIRLQQIVQEHKIREEALERELFSTRLALMRKIPPICSNQQAVDDADDVLNDASCRHAYSSECSSIGRCSLQSPPWPVMVAWNRDANFSSVNALMDNVENASVCSWEAVEEQRGYSISGCGSSSGSTNASGSVLWVPDHAVSQCTSCNTEFWLGRRKHHCRSCGQIFCADCSEFWAALPDERLYQPVRLCGPCYHSVTTKSQWLQKQQSSIRIDRRAYDSPPDKLGCNSCSSSPKPSTSCQSPDTTNYLTQVIPSVVASTSMSLTRKPHQLHHIQQQSQSITSRSSTPIISQPHSSNNTSNEPCKPAAGSSANEMGPLKAATATN